MRIYVSIPAIPIFPKLANEWEKIYEKHVLATQRHAFPLVAGTHNWASQAMHGNAMSRSVPIHRNCGPLWKLSTYLSELK